MLLRALQYTANSIYVVRSKLQFLATTPNGGLDTHWNLRIAEDENYKFLFCAWSFERERMCLLPEVIFL